MQIQMESTDALRVELTARELARFGLTYERLDYADRRTREMLRTLLRGAARVTGFARRPGRLMIEVFPAPGRGCLIYFTQPAPGEGAEPPGVYAFASSEALLAAVATLPPDAPPSELYERDGQYYLVLAARPGGALLEYGSALPADPARLAALREHGRLLAAPNAVNALRAPPR